MPALLPLLLAAPLIWAEVTAVAPGQRGLCVTEWTGGERWEIPVEVMGVLDAAAPGRTTVLVRLDDPRFTERGVVQGMSGSPVYVDGKLLGALAFGWPFARTPLAGVTPFSAMRAIPAAPGAAGAAVPALADLTGIASGSLAPYAALPRLAAADAGALPPLAVAGLPLPGPDVLAGLGLRAIPAASGAAVAGVPEAGDMLAALLVWGDAVVGAGGTVTAREGDLIWAFGHPFLNLGTVSLPAARARVLAVQDSFEVPFKFFAVGEPFGTVVADRTPGILARAGDVAPGVPVTVRVDEAGGDTTWSFRIAELPLVEPLLVTYLTNACLSARGAAAGLASVALRLEARFADGRSVAVSQATQGVDALARMAGFAGTVVSFLVNSPFPHPALTGLDVSLERAESAAGADLVEAVPARTTVRPGETLEVLVRLQPNDGPAFARRLALTVPATVGDGKLDLIVADGAAWSDYRVKAEGIDPASFADQLTQVAGLESSRTLVCVLEDRAGGVALPGASQPALPPSWAATLATGLGADGGLRRLTTAVVAAARWEAPFPLTGAFRIPLTVRRPAVEVP